jgi:hypothetical protein
MAISDEEAAKALEDLGKIETFMFEYGQRLTDAMEKGDAPYHAPHGLLTFAHIYYHNAYIANRDQECREVFEKAEAEGVNVDDVELDLDALQHDLLWKIFASLIMLGVHMEKEGLYEKLRQCNCTEVSEEDLMSLLHGGGEHGGK